MTRVALRSLRTHLRQFLLTALAVVLGVTFLSGTLALRGVLSDTFSALTASTMTADLYVSGPKVQSNSNQDSSVGGVLRNPVDASLVDQLKQVEGVAVAHPFVSLNVTLVGADKAPVSTTGAPSIAMPLFAGQRGRTTVSGTNPQGGDQIALESEALRRSGLKVGDKTHIVALGTPREVEVVGEFNYGTSMAGAVLVGMDPEWLVPVAAPDGKIDSVEVQVAEGYEVAKVKEAVSAAVPSGTQVRTRVEEVDEQNQLIEQILGYVQTFLLVFVVLAMFVGSFIIMNTFAMSVRQRQKEFALLRAVGASTLSVFLTVLLQAVVIGLLGSALGVLCGAGLTRLLVAVLEAGGMPLPGGVPMTSTIITTSIAVGVLVTVVGALLPARDAALTAPVEAMRQVSGAREQSLVLRTVLGLLLTAAGLAGVIAAWKLEDLDRRGPVLGAGAGLLLLGLLVSSPALSRPVVTVLGLPLRLLRPSGRLGTRNVVAAPRRTAATSAALLIGVALVSAGATVAASMQESIKDIVNSSMKADLMVTSASNTQTIAIPPEYVEKISKLDGVAEVSPFHVSVVGGTGPDGKQARTVLAAIDPPRYQRAWDAKFVSGAMTCVDDTHAVALKTTGFKEGDQINLTGPGGSTTVTVCGVADPKGVLASFYVSAGVSAKVGDLTGSSIADPAQVLANPHGMLLTLKDGSSQADLERVRKEAQEIVAPSFIYQVRDSKEISSQAGQQANQMLAVLYALLGLSIAIAILGIVNTLVLSVSERTREIGLMRAVGLGRSQLAGVIMIESVLTAVYGTVLGAGTGLLLASALRSYLADQGLSVLVIPWGQLIGMVITSVVVGVLAALWPALRATRLPVLEAIATE
ncbi:ABC transporter permease [Actinomyces trachealis]|uniref:ABC transporter permease n=1 Tax=Actinomyces trachealis TaxID=2763540 RepID=UPI0018C75134|nr:FtsX-like permease family protein [Actinomyces trachealis]